MSTIPIIALLTDFGTVDAYVGTMKGVMSGICPTAHFVDLTHAIEPQNVRQAAYHLLTAYRYFPPHTVFLVVVDPGVGTARAPIAAQTDHGYFVAPDNGVLSYVLAQVHVQRVIKLANPDYQQSNVSQTFHGRDIFSPAAAYLANGVPITELGPAHKLRHTLPQLHLAIAPDAIHGEVLHVDRFGNIITSIGQLHWTDERTLSLDPAFGTSHPQSIPPLDASDCTITLGDQTLHGIRRTYGAVPPGEFIALIGSAGQLEIGQNQGHAAQKLATEPGDPVILHLNPHS